MLDDVYRIPITYAAAGTFRYRHRLLTRLSCISEEAMKCPIYWDFAAVYRRRSRFPSLSDHHSSHLIRSPILLLPFHTVIRYSCESTTTIRYIYTFISNSQVFLTANRAYSLLEVISPTVMGTSRLQPNAALIIRGMTFRPPVRGMKPHQTKRYMASRAVPDEMR